MIFVGSCLAGDVNLTRFESGRVINVVDPSGMIVRKIACKDVTSLDELLNNATFQAQMNDAIQNVLSDGMEWGFFMLSAKNGYYTLTDPTHGTQSSMPGWSSINNDNSEYVAGFHAHPRDEHVQKGPSCTPSATKGADGNLLWYCVDGDKAWTQESAIPLFTWDDNSLYLNQPQDNTPQKMLPSTDTYQIGEFMCSEGKKCKLK